MYNHTVGTYIIKAQSLINDDRLQRIYNIVLFCWFDAFLRFYRRLKISQIYGKRKIIIDTVLYSMHVIILVYYNVFINNYKSKVYCHIFTITFGFHSFPSVRFLQTK